jgi:hypothetical protein
MVMVMASSTYVDKTEIVAVLRSRELHGRADWVDREMPEFIDTLENAALFRTLGIDVATVSPGRGSSASSPEVPSGDSSAGTEPKDDPVEQ